MGGEKEEQLAVRLGGRSRERRGGKGGKSEGE